MLKLTIGIFFYLITTGCLGDELTTSEVKEFDFIKKFELTNSQQDSNGNNFYSLNNTVIRKFKISEVFDSKKTESIVIDIIFRLEIPVNETFDLFQIHDGSKADPIKGSVYYNSERDDDESEFDPDSYNLSDYELFNDWYRLTFVYDFEKSKLTIFYDCDPDTVYEESIERKGFFNNHHRLQFHHLLHISIGGFSDTTEQIEFQYDIMKLTMYSGNDFTNLGFCQEIF